MKGKHEFLAKGDVGKATINGKKTYFRRARTPGGLVGLVAKHPLKAALAGGLGYLALKSRPSAEQRAEAATQAAAGTPFKNPTKEVSDMYNQQVSYENPLARKAWG